jgi:hypothetical protein
MGGKAALLVALLAVSLVLEIQADTGYGGGYTSTPTPITPSGKHHKPPSTPTPARSPTTAEPAADEEHGVEDGFVGVQYKSSYPRISHA